MLSLAAKARLIITGEEFCVDAIRKGTAKLVFLASDAGKNTYKKILDKCKFYNVDVCVSYTSDELSSAIGKYNRMVIAILDNGFAKSIKSKGCDCYGKKSEETGRENK